MIHSFVAQFRGAAVAAVAALALLAGTADTKAASARQPDAIPRLASGKPDFSGIWQTLSEADYDLEPHAGRRDAPPGPGVIEGGTIPYKTEALAQRKRNFDARAKDDPRLKCWVLGVPRSVAYQAPFQIFERDRDLTLVHQFGHQVRTIFTNGTGHQQDTEDGYYLGDSRGRWEGDTLVVDVTGFNEETWLDRSGNYHSDALHVTERWSFVDKDTISYRATIEDPKVFTRPWTIEFLLNRRRDKGFQLIEDYCYTLEYEAAYPHKEVKP
ncbi:MAG: hypothetical protein QHC67_01095 [Sphingobium sp.]|uniref:hypothetical protein n=1 Tax=Sphingobium sp. TaxID=1912891 RepID=UPI0029BE8339|nr:hypothetical protein [Sphingobium sp.]MDX3908404.1 hypothetical protein [Sphingobium sp.]